MTREEQICNQSVRYTKETHSPSNVSECQAAMNIAVMKAFIAGAQWADKTILQEVLGWLKEHCWRRETTASFLMQEDPPSYEIVMNFESGEELFQSFKERFNIGDVCDQQHPSDFINDR